MTDEEVEALPALDQPDPVKPFALDHPANGQGRGLQRRSGRGVRWCPFCQKILVTRAQTCTECQPGRRRNVDGNPRPANRPAPAAPQEDSEAEHDLCRLIDAVDNLARVVAMASAYQNTSRLTKRQVEDMFMASKELLVCSDPIRRRLKKTDLAD